MVYLGSQSLDVDVSKCIIEHHDSEILVYRNWRHYHGRFVKKNSRLYDRISLECPTLSFNKKECITFFVTNTDPNYIRRLNIVVSKHSISVVRRHDFRTTTTRLTSYKNTLQTIYKTDSGGRTNMDMHLVLFH